MRENEMPEMLLHFIWQSKQFHLNELQTTEGESVQIVHVGYAHDNAGPDFSDARLKIADTFWAGNVEIHVRSSEWFAHGHQYDPAYENVILHVVWIDDRPVYRPDGSRIPTLELRQRVASDVVRRYHFWLRSRQWIPCASQFGEVSSLEKGLWMDHLLVERLQSRVADLAERLQAMRGNWEQLFIDQLMWGFGLRVNAPAMATLARNISFPLLRRVRDRLPDLEALLFGSASLFPEEPEESYVQDLVGRWQHLVRAHGVGPVPGVSWKFSRMRPAGFPTIRLARLAAVLHAHPRWLRPLLEAPDVDAIRAYFDQPVSAYWQRHYRFGAATARSTGGLGEEFLRILVVNVIIPFVFFYGRRLSRQPYIDRALSWAEQLPAENNRIIRQWRSLSLSVQTAGQGQAALHWYKHYCRASRCLECRIGKRLLGRSGGTTFAEGNQPHEQKGG